MMRMLKENETSVREGQLPGDVPFLGTATINEQDERLL